jgi:hypothetical protein
MGCTRAWRILRSGTRAVSYAAAVLNHGWVSWHKGVPVCTLAAARVVVCELCAPDLCNTLLGSGVAPSELLEDHTPLLFFLHVDCDRVGPACCVDCGSPACVLSRQLHQAWCCLSQQRCDGSFPGPGPGRLQLGNRRVARAMACRQAGQQLGASRPGVCS